MDNFKPSPKIDEDKKIIIVMIVDEKIELQEVNKLMTETILIIFALVTIIRISTFIIIKWYIKIMIV